MYIIPAIDLIDGKCVRLEQGVYERKKVYHDDPLEVAKRFADSGIERLHLVDLDGAKASKVVNWKVLDRIANQTSLQIDWGGGIKAMEDLNVVFESGAQQATVGSIAAENPGLFHSWLETFGADKLILGADLKDGKVATRGWKEVSQLDWDSFFEMHISKGGSIPTDKELISWAQEVQERGAGEILFTSMDHDGTKSGFALESLQALSETLSIPIIASGGAGTIQHFFEVFDHAKADAGLAASIFHFQEISIKELKAELKQKGIPIR
ncbi:UNVERIFIED_CONTAM: hypothetical protein GTU68_041360 [Idotea baltica]|nr:hypothetical protein [Idotea baltica]